MRTTLLGEETTVSTRSLDSIDAQASLPGDALRDTQSRPAAKAAGPLGWVEASCRVLDVTVALLALLALSPVMLIIALLVRLESPGQAIFSQERVGRFQRRFTLHKFRTMTAGASHDRHRQFVQQLYAGERPAETAGSPRFKLAEDDRITRIGRFLRRSSLDELPQLWNVVRGEMSLVGPRPPIHYEVESYPAAHWFTRFDVKPGLTGLWQVSGRCDLTLDQMIALDIEYVQRRSLRLNIWILLRTLPAVVASRGAS
jgi:lipopolysaccharide/colanic/teichoic acid biosynthesis glycosyltransferase